MSPLHGVLPLCRCCNHRCQQRWGPCRGSAGAAGTAPSLQRLREEGPNLFAATAFDGVAFFPSLGRLLRQSAKRPKAEANVEVLFEEVKPKAFVTWAECILTLLDIAVDECTEYVEVVWKLLHLVLFMFSHLQVLTQIQG